MSVGATNPAQVVPAVATGRCYCGSIVFSVPVEEPIKAGYCHCDSCKRAHAAPLYQVVYIASSGFKIDQGSELLQPFRKSPPLIQNGKECQVIRSFCRKCGSKICNTWLPGERVWCSFWLDSRPIPASMEASVALTLVYIGWCLARLQNASRVFALLPDNLN
jgi:hypothetical protein